MATVISIKNMVCLRCIVVVQWTLRDLGIKFTNVQLGVAELAEEVNPERLESLNAVLKQYDLELLYDKRQVMVEKIKSLIRKLFDSGAGHFPPKFSEYLSKAMFYDYTYLSNIFAEAEGSTIERFYIETRLERAKDLILNEALTITEVAYKLNFSSVSHFCLQFKKLTGMTPAGFKKLLQGLY